MTLQDICYNFLQKDRYIYFSSYCTEANYVYLSTSDRIGNNRIDFLYDMKNDNLLDCVGTTSDLDINAEVPEIPESCKCYLVRVLGRMPELHKRVYAVDLLHQLSSMIGIPVNVELCDMYAVLSGCLSVVLCEKNLASIVKTRNWGTVPYARYMMDTSYQDILAGSWCFYLMPPYAERLVKYNENLDRLTYEKYINKGKDWDKSIKLTYEDDIKRCRVLIESETDDFFSSEEFKAYFRKWLDNFERNLDYICGLAKTPSTSVCEACLLMRFD